MTQPFSCVVTADLFRRAYAAVSTEETRFYLNGVNVEPCPSGSGAVLVGTDGHRLIAIRDGDAVVGERAGIVWLTPTMLKALAARPKRGGPAVYRVLAVKGDKAAVVELPKTDGGPDYATALSLVDRPDHTVVAFQWCDAIVDAEFPDWRRAVGEPAENNAPVGAVNVEILAPLVHALNDSTGTPGFRFWPSAAGGIFAIPYTGKIEGFGIVMTMRGPAAPPSVPDWLKPSAQPAAA